MTAKIYINNAPDLKDGTGKWLRSYSIEPYTKYLSRSGQLWINMESRCSGKYQMSYPAYAGTENGFKDFQEFAEWCQSQDGYMEKVGKRYWQLDKDLLVPGNKQYSKDTCVFVPSEINSLFLDVNDNGLKLGVGIYSYDESKFTAHCNRSGKSKGWLGVFNTEDEAHDAWKVAKAAVVAEFIEKYKAYPRLTQGLRNKAASLGLPAD